MLLNAYSIYDEKAMTFGNPFFIVSDEAAKRSVSLSANQDSILSACPGDFKLYRVGEFDTTKGLLHSLAVIEHVSDIASLIPSSLSAGLSFNGRRSIIGEGEEKIDIAKERGEDNGDS